MREEFSSFAPANAEKMRIAVGVLSYCRFFSNCTGTSNSNPWFDDVALGVYGNPNAPYISASVIQIPQDAFPENGGLSGSAPGRIDAGLVKGATSPETGSSLGDTLLVTGGGKGVEVWVEFAVRPGPGIDTSRLGAWLGSHSYRGSHRGRDWVAARMDTAEQGKSGPVSSRWMTTYHESDPNFTGTDRDLDPTDLDPKGQMTRLANDIFPDDLFTPGTRIDLFYRSKYLAAADLPANWFFFPDTAGGNFLEWECLPSSMAGDGNGGLEWNCVLYVDHFDERGAQPFIEGALGNILGFGSENFEHTNWDRYDVRAPASQQASFGRPLGTEYGATLVQALGYSTILWNSGNLNAFNLTKEDGDVLIPWLLLQGTGDHGLYLSGDGIVTSAIADGASEPSARELVQDIAGVTLRCQTFRAQNCPLGSAVDGTECPEIVPMTGARASVRPLGGTHFAQGNGCPTYRSFDVIAPNPLASYGAPTAEESYVGALKTATSASVSNRAARPSTFKTLVDGFSVHYRRDPGDCRPAPTNPPSAVEERLREALTWLGALNGSGQCTYLAFTGVAPGLDPEPAPRTRLADPAPNPVTAGRIGKIRFSLAHAGPARVEVFDLSGRRVRTLFDGPGDAGWNETQWDGRDTAARPLAAGVYFLRLRAGENDEARRIVVIRGS